jgi:hypothetical protein
MFILPTQVTTVAALVRTQFSHCVYGHGCSFTMANFSVTSDVFDQGATRVTRRQQGGGIPLCLSLISFGPNFHCRRAEFLFSAAAGPVAEDIANFLHAVPDIITAIELLTYAKYLTLLGSSFVVIAGALWL